MKSISDENTMSVKIIVFGDPHFDVSSIDIMSKFTKSAREMAKDVGADAIVCTGDLLDKFETMHVDAHGMATDYCGEMEDISRFFLIIGNHDLPHKHKNDLMSSRHGFKALKRWKNTTVVDRVISTRITSPTCPEGMKFVFVPYVDVGRFMEALETMPDWRSDTVAIFAHQEFYGVDLNDASSGTRPSAKGDKWPADYPLIVTGHIHKAQIPQTNILCVGSSRQVTFAETDQKTMWVLTFSITNDAQNPRTILKDMNRFDLGLPTKRTECIKYSEIEKLGSIQPRLNEELKVFVEGTHVELKHFDQRLEVQEARKRGIKVRPREINDRSNVVPIDSVRIKQGYQELLYTSLDDDLKAYYNEVIPHASVGH
jgi:DNA repair exonuclease SbcCD nuclease subunit